MMSFERIEKVRRGVALLRPFSNFYTIMNNHFCKSPIFSLTVLALIALSVILVVGQPFGHQHSQECLVELELCSVCLLGTGLALLGCALVLALLVPKIQECGPVFTRTVPLRLFQPRFTCPNRPPPRS